LCPCIVRLSKCQGENLYDCIKDPDKNLKKVHFRVDILGFFSFNSGMKIALIQLYVAFEAKRTNYKRTEEFIKKASQEACDIAMLPELFHTGFSKNIALMAEDEDGETASALSQMAKTYHINLIAGFTENAIDAEKVKNIAAVYNREGICIAKYTKIHPFSFAKEDRYFVSGDRLVTFDVEGLSAGIFICYDLRFPEIFRSVAKDVQAIFVIANWPMARKDHWETLLKARAIENQCFIIGVNRTGTDPVGLLFPGASHIFDPMGTDLCCGNETEELVIAEIEVDDVKRVRATFPFLQDMRSFHVEIT
jgi:omega-amidase